MLSNKVAVIIGAGQQPGDTIGNGRAVAEVFAKQGAKLFLVDKNEEWLQETIHTTRSIGAEVYGFIGDVTQEETCQKIIQSCVDVYGRIDILHNNIGKSKGDNKTDQLSVDTWQEIMDLNLKSIFMLCKHAIPEMKKIKSGCIINISSTSSVSSRPTIAYKTSKGALNTLTQHIATENAKFGIRANAILPGLIDTPMAIERRAAERGVSREVIREERNAMVPMGFMGSAYDVAQAAAFLASDNARYITGVLLPVDGGLICKRG